MKNSLPHFKFGSWEHCCYCGELADCSDHVIAVSYQQLGRDACKVTCGPTTPSCHECNRHLTNLYFDTFLDRCNYINAYLEGRALPTLWTQREITENLTGKLRVHVEQTRNRRLWYRYRADWFSSVDFLTNLRDLPLEPCLDPSHPSYSSFLRSFFSSTLLLLAAESSRT